jgi:hypothetical protein
MNANRRARKRAVRDVGWFVAVFMIIEKWWLKTHFMGFKGSKSESLNLNGISKVSTTKALASPIGNWLNSSALFRGTFVLVNQAKRIRPSLIEPT